MTEWNSQRIAHFAVFAVHDDRILKSLIDELLSFLGEDLAFVVTTNYEISIFVDFLWIAIHCVIVAVHYLNLESKSLTNEMKWLKELGQSRMPIDPVWKISKQGASNYQAADSCMSGSAGKLGNCRHVKEEASLSRDWLVSQWLADRKRESKRQGRKQKLAKQVRSSNAVLQRQPSLSVPLGRCFSGKYGPEERSVEDTGPSLTQPPLSQSAIGFLEPSSSEELKVAPLLARSNLLITRRIEWANLVVGFEQENRYAILDACYPKQPVGFILEQSNVIARQLLRTRRPFVAHITDGIRNELFKVRRPFWWINSSIFAEIDGKEIGVVHRRWHLWRRVYDLYLGKQQFAIVENPGFWNWTFTLRDIEGNVLAEIDRNWRGFGFELLTDAGQYVIRFGDADHKSKSGPPEMIEELKVVRPLTLSERAVTLALAVSLDNDYFSRHGGWGIPFVDIGE
ncbi:hypothetical protein Syun_018069 [Stephania yunnanensis]|uniref:Phospholipid scramblase n=1 Tax=Stephania yunnanensis TaxID=152371 RepID=A0AAP0ITI1_9MAGN